MLNEHFSTTENTNRITRAHVQQPVLQTEKPRQAYASHSKGHFTMVAHTSPPPTPSDLHAWLLPRGLLCADFTESY